MVSSRDSRIIELWLERQASPHTRGCYRRDAARLLAHAPKPLSRLTFGDLQGFAQSLTASRPCSLLASPDAGGRQELVRILAAHGLCSLQPRRRTFAVLLRETVG